MAKNIFSLLLFLTIFISCKHASRNAAAEKHEGGSDNTTDTTHARNYKYQIEQECLVWKGEVCNQLALYDIERDTVDYELRAWKIPSMWNPYILYILKGKDTTWTLFHYQLYINHTTEPNQNSGGSLIDSVAMESVKPQNSNWQNYIKELQLDSLWNLQTESLITGKNFGVLDGYRVLLEFTEKGKYKYLYYTEPEYFKDKDINHKRFVEFMDRLVNPIIYDGMHNPW